MGRTVSKRGGGGLRGPRRGAPHQKAHGRDMTTAHGRQKSYQVYTSSTRWTQRTTLIKALQLVRAVCVGTCHDLGLGDPSAINVFREVTMHRCRSWGMYQKQVLLSARGVPLYYVASAPAGGAVCILPRSSCTILACQIHSSTATPVALLVVLFHNIHRTGDGVELHAASITTRDWSKTGHNSSSTSSDPPSPPPGTTPVG